MAYSSRSTRDAEIAYFVGVLKMSYFIELYAPVFVAISATYSRYNHSILFSNSSGAVGNASIKIWFITT